MPNKHNAPRYDHIPKMKFRVKDLAECGAGLWRRGSLTLWVIPKVLDGWQAARRTTPGGQSSYSELAIETGIMLRMAFHLSLRQSEGLMASILGLLSVLLIAPNNSTLSQRARKMESISKGCILPDGLIHLLIDSTGLKVFGTGEWLKEKHGARARRTWRKLHLAVDADTRMVMASTLTQNEVGDPSQVAPLLDPIEAMIASVTADGAGASLRRCGRLRRRYLCDHPALHNGGTCARAPHNSSQRDKYILSIAARGSLSWQGETNYGQRALVETATADTRPSSVLACERETSLARRARRLSAWPSSIEFSTQAARTRSAVLTSPRKLAKMTVARPPPDPCNYAPRIPLGWNRLLFCRGNARVFQQGPSVQSQ